jgi:chorismate mutase
MQKPADLTTLRQQIDQLDIKLLEILSERMKLVSQIGVYKKSRGLKIIDVQRKKQVLSSLLSHAGQLKLPAQFIRHLFQLIHKYAVIYEEGSGIK